MKQSQLFTKTRREAPKDEMSKNAELLIRGGFIHKEIAGAYSYLPLGLRVLNKIIGVIREEMNKIGGQEVFLTSLQEPDAWKKSGRWDDAAVDIWFKSELKAGGEVGFANTHEEPLTRLLTQHVSSYKDLPLYIYQFQTKFRNELRAKSGIMRTREFIMKDLYSFSRSEEEFKAFYETCASAYKTIFTRVGVGDRTYRTFASGGSFSKFSDEFQTLSPVGEDTIYIHEGKGIAINKEVYTDEVLADLGLEKSELKEERAVEVGNIFPLGTRFSKALGLTYKDESGNSVPPVMGCYGIGPGRLMGTIVEVLSDEKGIVWPKEVAPFAVHLIELSGGSSSTSSGQAGDVREEAKEVYRELSQAGVEVLWDERDARAGEKFADADLIGIPLRVVISEKTLAEGLLECTHRANGKTEHLTTSELLGNLAHA